MIRVTTCALLLLSGLAATALAQGAATSALASPAPKTAASVAADKAAAGDPLKTALGGKLFGAPSSGQPITTEVYANEAYFDSKEYIGIFTGQVVVKDPRFNLQADKLTVYLGKGEQTGLDRAVAEGNVGVLHEAPGENGAPPTRSVARAERAVYTAKDGNVELTGTPRVQSGLNTHVATSPDTVMILNQSGQLTTRGPSRTEIRQEPKAEPPPKP